ncbi:MAG: hypothetical protein ABI537_15465 [Casimicrobiaceae bacterium]
MSLAKFKVLLLMSAALLSPLAATAQLPQQGPKLVGSSAVGISLQGISVSTSSDGNTAIVGGYGDNANAGAAWVYIRSGVTWSQQGPKLVGAGATGNAKQGISVSLSADGNTAIVGGYEDDSLIGATWVFTRAGGIWTQQGPKLVGTGATANAQQGYVVSLSRDGNTAVIGGYGDNGGVGAVWIFARSGGVWTQQGAKLIGTGAVGSSIQGTAVSLSVDGNTALVGGANDNSFVGAVWVYTRSGGVWTQQGGKIVGTGATGAARQGISVALAGDGNTALVGGYLDNATAGASWVYTRSGGVWTQQGSKLVGSGAVGNARQGYSVALSDDGNTGAVGGYADNANAGAAWMFSRSGSVWTQLGSKLVGTGAVGAALQGASVALSGDSATAIVGGYGDNSGIGAAWVYSSVVASLASDLVYTPIGPCRIMDTRHATLASGVQGPLQGNILYQIPGFIQAGQNWGPYGGTGASDCGLTNPPGPAIHAVAIVVTILAPNFDAYLGVSDFNELNTVLANVALNYTRGQGLSTMYIVPQIATNNIYFAMPPQLVAHLIYDVVGYYVAPTTSALQCTTQSSAASSIAGLGGTGTATSPACSAGFSLTGGSCDGGTGLKLVSHEATLGDTAWFCSAINASGAPSLLTATAKCCRVPGK